MGKLHYKGKKNFTEHLTKFPDAYGLGTKTARHPWEAHLSYCFEEVYTNSALPREMQSL